MQAKKESNISVPNDSPLLSKNEKNVTLASIESHLAEVKALADSKQSKQMDQVIEQVIAAHMSTCNFTADKVAAGRRRYDEMGRLECVGKVVSNSLDMMRGGLTSDKMWAHMVRDMAPVMTRIITFCKKIPEFNQLSEADQVALLRRGSFCVVLARFSRLIESKAMFLPNMEVKLPRAMLNLMPMASFFEEQFKFAETFNSLALEDGELALLSAITIMNPDCKHLEDSESVSRFQGVFLKSLYTYMKRLRPDNYSEVFHAALSTLPHMERINTMHSQQLRALNLQGTPQLHRDIFL
jgi:hypothetical protein